MKPNTPVWFQCESIGRPADGLKMRATTREAIMTIAQWLTGVYMGSKIRITIARSEEELAENRRTSTVAEMMSELDSLIPQEQPE